MAFNDLPQIDPSAKNSETSIRKMQDILNFKSGFICRADNPDTGIDFEVELILDTLNASAWKFPIQLKSIIREFSKTESESLVTYSFSTSRLNYLMRRLPTMGLIVIYSDKEDLLLYEFVDRIYERVMTERNTEEWKTNDSVNIHIPIENILNEKSALSIHKVLSQRFKQNEIMHSQHGIKYKLPVADFPISNKYDLSNVEGLKMILHEFGPIMLNNYDIQYVYELVSRLTHEEICADNKLLLFSIFAYSETGRYAESALYYNKLKKKDPTLIETEISLKFVKSKNDLSLGNIQPDEFIYEIKQLKNDSISELDSITISINITFYELLQLKALHPIPRHIFSDVDNIFSRIESSNLKINIKTLLTLWNLDNFGLLSNSFRHRQFSEFRIQESMGGEYTLEEKKERILLMTSYESRFNLKLEELNQYASKNNDHLLKAYIWSLHNRYSYAKEVDYFAFNVISKQNLEHKGLLTNNIILGLQAYNIFIDLNRLKDAYYSLCTSIELLEVSRLIYKYEDEFNKEELLKFKLDIEIKLDIEPYIINIQNLALKINHAPIDVTKPPSFDFLKDMDDTQLESLAKMTLNSNHLPEHRLINIMNELKSYRLFVIRDKEKKYELFQSYPFGFTRENLYDQACIFVLRSKLTGIQSHESSNVDELLISWGL